MINGINTSAVTIWWHPIKQRPAAPLSWVMSNDFLISDIVLSHFDYFKPESVAPLSVELAHLLSLIECWLSELLTPPWSILVHVTSTSRHMSVFDNRLIVQ